MRAILRCLVLGLAMLVLPAIAQADDRNFGVINQTGYTIRFLGVNPPGDNDWDDNELSTPLRQGDRFGVKFSGADRGCTWNIKVTWTDGSSSYFRGLNLCEINNVTLRYNRGTDIASYTTD